MGINGWSLLELLDIVITIAVVFVLFHRWRLLPALATTPFIWLMAVPGWRLFSGFRDYNDVGSKNFIAAWDEAGWPHWWVWVLWLIAAILAAVAALYRRRVDHDGIVEYETRVEALMQVSRVIFIVTAALVIIFGFDYGDMLHHDTYRVPPATPPASGKSTIPPVLQGNNPNLDCQDNSAKRAAREKRNVLHDLKESYLDYRKANSNEAVALKRVQENNTPEARHHEQVTETDLVVKENIYLDELGLLKGQDLWGDPMFYNRTACMPTNLPYATLTADVVGKCGMKVAIKVSDMRGIQYGGKYIYATLKFDDPNASAKGQQIRITKNGTYYHTYRTGDVRTPSLTIRDLLFDVTESYTPEVTALPFLSPCPRG